MTIATIHQENVPLFFDKKNQDLYWEALIQIAQNHKQNAMQIAEEIKKKTPLHISSDWQEKVPSSIEGAFNKFFLTSVESDPETLTSLGLFESIGIREQNGYLTCMSPAFFLSQFEKKKESLKMLMSYKEKKLKRDDQISLEIFLWLLQDEMEQGPFLFHSFAVNQLFGVVQNLSMLLGAIHPLEVKEDVLTYEKRLLAIPQKFSETMELLEYQKKKGILPPRFAIEKSIMMIQEFLDTPIEKNLFFVRLLSKIDSIEMEMKEKVLLRVKKTLEKVVLPSYLKLQKVLKTSLDALKENHGVWSLPNGDDYYAKVLKTHTTTNLTPEEIHQVGLKEVSSIEKKMRELLEKLGYSDKKAPLSKLFSKFAENKKFYFSNDDEGKGECLSQYEAILRRSREKLWPLFNLRPKTLVELEPVPKHEELGAPAAYYLPGSLDGSRPGVFYVNLRNLNENPKFGMQTLAVHEAEPGHHFQISIQNEMDMPVMRKLLTGFTAYVEGWALYAEKLAYEEGFYETIPDELGHFQAEMMRAVRLVVDTGIHYKRWSREKAIDYMVLHTGMAYDEVVTEVERYFVLPGQACSYKIGQLTLLSLRDKVKNRLKEEFDIRKFHDAVLKLGASPLSVLEEVISKEFDL